MSTHRTYSSGFDDLVGLRMIEADGDRVVAELFIESKHLQPGGIVHGGLYATLVETTASVGASLWLGPDGVAMGIANHTDFLRVVGEGRLRAEAVPVERGRTLQLWEVLVTDVQQRPIAHGKVRLMNRSA
ncbi:MAG: hotdog fold thioesterase [Nitriliruptorales bacterium]|nr:hotdog fold thioesterase [Nitriliruptorales bacterium]